MRGHSPGFLLKARQTPEETVSDQDGACQEVAGVFGDFLVVEEK